MFASNLHFHARRVTSMEPAATGWTVSIFLVEKLLIRERAAVVQTNIIQISKQAQTPLHYVVPLWSSNANHPDPSYEPKDQPWPRILVLIGPRLRYQSPTIGHGQSTSQDNSNKLRTRLRYVIASSSDQSSDTILFSCPQNYAQLLRFMEIQELEAYELSHFDSIYIATNKST
ncbi:hypothetical protein EVAR_52750_1 [Eumeta japonica]|uniref:Uncharacterized protein n=1 Tax=Eumeta variegata TaxID=151549 RepID=A0A4C1XE59_EUMVA|nr:hypothetical protein EVAR_52750_1 [Eumeta japonica]